MPALQSLSFETFLIHSPLYVIHFKAQWVDKDNLYQPTVHVFVIFTAGIFFICSATMHHLDIATESMWSVLNVCFYTQTKEIISSSPECGMMLHHLSSDDQRQEKQANWHSQETRSWRIDPACLKIVKIFSLKLCNAKVCNAALYVI